jgi:hypothetical protein
MSARTFRGPGHLRRTAHRPGPVPALWAGVSYREAVSPRTGGSGPRAHGPKALLGASPEGANGGWVFDWPGWRVGSGW